MRIHISLKSYDMWSIPLLICEYHLTDNHFFIFGYSKAKDEMSENSMNESIDKYKDYIYIMYIVCDKTSSFYSKIKNAVNIPIIIISTALSILNTTDFDKNNVIDNNFIYMIRYVSIGFNITIAVLIGVLTHFKIVEKEYSFKTHAMNFLKLYNKINAEVTKCKTIMLEVDIVNIINEYNLLCEYVTFHIPNRIRKQIQKNYSSYKMPLLVTNTKKEKNHHKPTLKYFINMMVDKKKILVIIVMPMNLPHKIMMSVALAAPVGQVALVGPTQKIYKMWSYKQVR